jgi:hypothetical protein
VEPIVGEHFDALVYAFLEDTATAHARHTTTQGEEVGVQGGGKANVMGGKRVSGQFDQ